jgi:c(7)-type cytochrome triheme protein
MALLSRNARAGIPRSRAGRIRAAIVGALALLSLAGCMIGKALSPGEKRFAFSHAAHGEAQSLACADCHSRWQDSEDPGLPRAAKCAICHSTLDAAKPPERQVASLFGDDGFRAAHASRQSDEIVFSHKSHAARTDCKTCHADVVRDTGSLAQLGDKLRMSMDACIACHTASTGPRLSDCAACHVEIRAGVAPPSHRADWKRFHGTVVRGRPTERSEQCALCHQPSECTQCHSIDLPANHTNYWRRRAHGLTASMDRQSCSTCHDPDSCQRCHEEMRPQSHVGGFGAPQDRHCLYCHEPVRSSTCGVCHPATPSHETATPLPPDHNPAMNCRMCHGHGQPLPHVDNGQSCVTCHH